jgi:uncharacterized membrane protein HdeD (DUF308 family)
MQVAQQALQSFRRMLLVRGVIAILFGVVALVMPNITLTFLVYLFGAYAAINGIAAVATALRYTKEQGWALLLVEGIVSILVGVAAFVWPGITSEVFLYLIAAWAIVIGIMEIVAAFTLPLGTGYEWLLGLAGVVSISFGVLLAVRPNTGLVVLVYLLGIYAIVFGILYIVGYFQTRSLASS